MASSRSANPSMSAGAASGPAAHTTTCPPDHDACSRISPAGSPAATALMGSGAPVSRSSADSSRSSSLSMSATAWSRSGPLRRRAASSWSSVSSSNCSSVARHARGSASSRAICSLLATPSAAAHAADSRPTVALFMYEPALPAPGLPHQLGAGAAPCPSASTARSREDRSPPTPGGTPTTTGYRVRDHGRRPPTSGYLPVAGDRPRAGVL
jgi:hypothetical protein